MTQAERRLADMLERVFADGVLEDHERAELRALYTEGGLKAPRVRELFSTFLEITYARAASDGVITPDERQKLRAIVDGLKLPDELVPDAVKKLVQAPAP